MGGVGGGAQQGGLQLLAPASRQVTEGPKEISLDPRVSLWRALANSFSFAGSFLPETAWICAHLPEHSQWGLLACVATWWPLSHIAAVMPPSPRGNLGKRVSNGGGMEGGLREQYLRPGY